MNDIRIDFPELGEGQYVVMRDAATLPWRVQRQLAEAASDLGETAAKLRTAEIITVALLKSGNVLDWDGNPITFPITDATVGDLPGEVLAAVATKFGETKGVALEKK